MSTPLVPSNTCCSEQGNINEAKNNNESETDLGDSNANQIFPTGNIHEQSGVHSSNEKSEILGTWKSGIETLSSEGHRAPLDCGEGAPISDVLSDTKFHSSTNKDYITTDDNLKTFLTQGQTYLNSKTSTYERSSVLPLNKASESSLSIYSNNSVPVAQADRVKGLSFLKSGIVSLKTEPFIKEHPSPPPAIDSPSRHVPYFQNPSHGIRASPVDHLFGLSSHSLNNTSEEKKIVFYSKLPTSDIKAPEFSMAEEIVSNKQSTIQHSSSIDHHSRLTYKPQVICSVSEAQLYQGKASKVSELTDSKCMNQSKHISQQKTNHISLVELPGVKKTESVSESRTSPLISESRTSPLIFPRGQSDGFQSNKMLKQTDKFVCSSPKMSSVNLRMDEYAAIVSNNERNTKPALRKTVSLSESLENKTHLYKDRVSEEENLCQGSDNTFISSSSVIFMKDKTALADNRKTAIGRKHQTDILKGNIKESHKNSTDSFLCTPIPSCPLAALNINDQRITPTSSLKDLNAVQVDRLSPSSVLPPIESTQLFNISPTATNKMLCNSGIPKPILIHSKPSLADKGDMEINYSEKIEEMIEPAIILPKPKPVRPKIITYIRRNPQAVDRIPFGHMGLPYGTPTSNIPASKEQELLSNDIKTSNVLLDKYKTDIQKSRIYSSSLMVSGIRPPGHHFGDISEKSIDETGERQRKEEFCSPTFAHYEVSPSFYRSTMILKPQLGLGAVSRLPSAKSRILIASQRSSSNALTQQEQLISATSISNPDVSEDLKKSCFTNGGKLNLPKPCQSGLRPPGYSRLPAAKLSTFGFVRSSSVSSLSSNQSNESIPADQSRAPNAGTNEEQSTQKAGLSSKDIPKGSSRTLLQVCSSTTVPRRSLLPAPKSTTSPAGLKKEVQKDHEIIKPIISSPKKQVVSTAKLQSPGHPKLRPTIQKNGYTTTKPEVQTREADRQLVQKLKEKCEEHSKKLFFVEEEYKKASHGFLVFAVTTQYFFNKNEVGLMKEKELSVELATIHDEVAFNITKCEKLQKEKEELEIKFDNEVRKLESQQQGELQALKDQLQLHFNEEIERLRKEQNVQLLRIQSQHQEQIEDIAANHEIALEEMKQKHSTAITALQDDNENRVDDMRANHELEKKMLEDSFEKLRLSLQDQVDTLTFQNHSLRDRAKRFEEALMKSTNEQLEIALAPYRHLDEDLKSVKQVLEMKNQLIHAQEKRIMELEKLAELNVILEERIQVLQQQNEDMKARIDQNVVVTRQLSVENANLQESVEKESEEKKRLSRTNEELVWKLQTADSMSPVKVSPSLSHSASGPLSPSKVSTTPR
ncbi:microtubule-associated tumor suppressor candidate 2 [Bombina bombina]|uniref:microtubule-associated tumor suppressor candidate 2 n=1 Tax=Bombina bombina TaxID=8345 RepID=UPI00235AB627|nr:microtubule-associated tumor suppressor candidate 2 [Bombina bombina]